MRKSTLLAALLVLNFMTACMGLPLTGEDGKFSVSNIAPVLFVAVAGLFFFSSRQSVDRKVIWYLLAFNVGCALSFLIYLFRYEWDPNFAVLLFQDVEIVFALLLWWYGQEEPLQFRAAVKAGIFWSVPVLAAFAWHERAGGEPWISFGMDDKSQSAVCMCCEAYILVRFFGDRLSRLVALALYVATFMTISRLPAFFFPPIILAFMRGSRYAPVVTIIGTGIAVAVLVVAGDTIKDVFVVYDRLSSVTAVTESGSTTAHLLLLKTALEIKFSDPVVMLFGIGPGNFSKALISFPVSLDEIQAVDPLFVAFALQGRAPLHSLPMQALLDYALPVFLLIVYAGLRIFRYLLRRRNLADVMFFAGALLASTFYSVHNKPYFYLIAVTVAVLLTRETATAEQRGSELESDPAPALHPAGV